MQIASFINGSFYKSSQFFVKKDPFTLAPRHEVSSCDLAGFLSAMQSANKAFAEFKDSTFEQRLIIIEALLKVIQQKSHEWARLEAGDQALPATWVEQCGFQILIDEIRLHIANYKPTTADQSGGQIAYMPVGVISVVCTWNLSFRQILNRLVPALLAGNAVLVKVSSQSPITAFILSELLALAEVPNGLVNVIVTSDEDVKKLFFTHPGIKALSLTGRLETAQAALQSMMQNNLQSFKKIQIGSGSKNSAVVLTEPEPALAAAVMESFMLGQGQLGWGSARLFILEKFEKQWAEQIADYLAALKPSEGIDDTSLWTPILKESSFSQYEEIRIQAREDQAKLIAAGYALSEQQKKIYLPPIFTQDMSRCSTLQQDQVHSPFFILSTVKYPFDVPKYSNVSYFGFAAHLYGDPQKLQKISQELEVGLICFNKSSVQHVGCGIYSKQSGYGLQDAAPNGLFFTNKKTLY